MGYVLQEDVQVKSERYYSLQALRAVAAWMVVYHHFMQMFFAFHYESLSGKFFSVFGNFGVDIFFVLSGFVMYQSAIKAGTTPARFMVDRIFRIVPVYWFYTGIMVIALACLPQAFSYTGYNWHSLLASLFFYPVENPAGLGVYPLLTVGWTLNFEMFFYVLLSICLMVSGRFGVVLCGLLLVFFPFVYPSDFYLGRVASSKLLYEFLAGMLIAWVWLSSRIDRILTRRWVFMVLSVVLLVLCSMKVSARPALKLPMAASIVFFVLLLEPLLNWTKGLLALLVRLGDESYSTYLCHTIVIGVVASFWAWPREGYWFWLVVVLVSLLVWLCSSLSARFVEKNRLVGAAKMSLMTLLSAGGIVRRYGKSV